MRDDGGDGFDGDDDEEVLLLAEMDVRIGDEPPLMTTSASSVDEDGVGVGLRPLTLRLRAISLARLDEIRCILRSRA